MKDEADRELQAQLDVFRGRFLARLEGTLAAFAQQLSGDALPLPVLREIHFQLHRLAGSGGTLGFELLSRQARTLELQAQAWLDAGVAVPTAQGAGAAWKTAVLALGQTVPGPPTGACGRGEH